MLAGDQPWAKKISEEFEIANHNARVLAKTQSIDPADRPRVLQATAIAFGAGLIGKDRSYSDSYGKGTHVRQPPANAGGVGQNGSNNPRTDRADRRNGNPKTVAAVTRSGSGQDRPPPPPETGGGGRNDPESLGVRYRIDWQKVKDAGTGERGPLRDIAALLFPNADGTDYNLEQHDAGFPQATVIMRNPEDGKVRLRPDKTVDKRYMRGLSSDGTGECDCRFCAKTCAGGVSSRLDPTKRFNQKGFTDAQRTGAHNPKRCENSIAMLLKTKQGEHFLEDRSKSRYK